MATISSNNIETAQVILERFYEAERRYMSTPPEARDFSQLAVSLHPEMLLHQSPDMPCGGEYKGHAGFMEWSEGMASCFDAMVVTNPKVMEKDNDYVVCSTLRLRFRSSGEEIVEPLIQMVKIDREKGQIREIRPFYWNVRGINEAIGRGRYGL
jgi:hypothetical protein